MSSALHVNCPCCDKSVRRDNLNVSHIATHSVEMRDAMTPEDRDRCVAERIPVVFHNYAADKGCGACLVCKKSYWKVGGYGTREGAREFMDKHKASCGGSFDKVLCVFQGTVAAKSPKANKVSIANPFAAPAPAPVPVVVVPAPVPVVVAPAPVVVVEDPRDAIIARLAEENERLRDRLTSAEAAVETAREPESIRLMKIAMEHLAGRGPSEGDLAQMVLDAGVAAGVAAGVMPAPKKTLKTVKPAE